MIGYTDDRTNMSQIGKTKLSPRSVLLMHIIDAIASRRKALCPAKAMITHMGFHATLSSASAEGCVTQLVNPLSASSLIGGPGRVRDPARRPPRGGPARPKSAGYGPTGQVAVRSLLCARRSGCRVARDAVPGGAPPAPRRPVAAHAPSWIVLCTSVGWCGRYCARGSVRFGATAGQSGPAPEHPESRAGPPGPPGPGADRWRLRRTLGPLAPRWPAYAAGVPSLSDPLAALRYASPTSIVRSIYVRPEIMTARRMCSAQFTNHGVVGVIG